MLFTRRRWDAWILLGTLLTTAVGVLQVLALGEPASRLAAGFVMAPLWLLRYGIRPEGEPRPTFRDLPSGQRHLVVWCMGWLLGGLPLLVLLRVRFGPVDRWALWPLPLAVAFWFTATLGLARRADRERRSP